MGDGRRETCFRDSFASLQCPQSQVACVPMQASGLTPDDDGQEVRNRSRVAALSVGIQDVSVQSLQMGRACIPTPDGYARIEGCRERRYRHHGI
jgi:hypothetical protein